MQLAAHFIRLEGGVFAEPRAVGYPSKHLDQEMQAHRP
jgi:hypothetical protein